MYTDGGRIKIQRVVKSVQHNTTKTYSENKVVGAKFDSEYLVCQIKLQLKKRP